MTTSPAGCTAAAEAYRRFLGMWSKGELAVQPMVTRARTALARIGG